MKALITVALLFPVFGVSAQNIIELPLENGVWKEETVMCTMIQTEKNGEEIWVKDYTRNYTEIYSTGDTIINDTVYWIIENNNFGIVGAIRQDSAMVFYRHFYENQTGNEIVLYDFNVTDTFTITDFHKSKVSLEVISIDTININGVDRKRIEFDEEDIIHSGRYWIEGIGSSGGLLRPFYPTEIPTCDACCGVEDNLVCLTDNSDLLYLKDNYFDCDSIHSSSSPLYATKSKIQVTLQNSNILVVQSSADNLINLVEIYNQEGRLVRKEKVYNTHQYQMYLRGRGLRIVKVYTKNGIKTSKIMLID